MHSSILVGSAAPLQPNSTRSTTVGYEPLSLSLSLSGHHVLSCTFCANPRDTDSERNSSVEQSLLVRDDHVTVLRGHGAEVCQYLNASMPVLILITCRCTGVCLPIQSHRCKLACHSVCLVTDVDGDIASKIELLELT
jgi:hypothetical protein